MKADSQGLFDNIKPKPAKIKRVYAESNFYKSKCQTVQLFKEQVAILNP